MQTITVAEAAKLVGVSNERITQKIRSKMYRAMKVPTNGGQGYKYLLDASQFTNGNGHATGLKQQIEKLEQRVAELERLLLGAATDGV